jgi:hypothetical protein
LTEDREASLSGLAKENSAQSAQQRALTKAVYKSDLGRMDVMPLMLESNGERREDFKLIG